MGENARRLVETTYTWDRVALMTEEAYAESIELRKKGLLTDDEFSAAKKKLLDRM